jgi:hypothetical protein
MVSQQLPLATLIMHLSYINPSIHPAIHPFSVLSIILPIARDVSHYIPPRTSGKPPYCNREVTLA